MKKIALAALALSLGPVAGFAQQAPPAGAPPDGPSAMAAPDPARLAAMRATREQIAGLHRTARAQMLASLTPQHRALLATTIGQYAVSADPDPAALAKAIDALLSKNEAQSVVNIAASERVNERAMMQAARAQMEATLPADRRAEIDAREQKMEAMHAGQAARTPDPGRELARALAGGALGWGGRGEHGPGGELEGRPQPPPQ